MPVKNIIKKTGLPPGSLIYTGEKPPEDTLISLLQYNSENFEISHKTDFETMADLIKPGDVNWININSVQNISMVEKIGRIFGIHNLILEDILNTEHRPKTEEFENQLFFTLKMALRKNGVFEFEQLSLILGKDYVISFQERSGDVFDSLRERIFQNLGKIRGGGNDFLFYALIDTIVDNYFPMIGELEENIDQLEMKVLDEPTVLIGSEILEIKKKLIDIRKFIFPVREEFIRILRADDALIGKKTKLYFKDVHEHLTNLTSLIEAFRETIAVLVEVNVSSSANRLNQVMKTLTVIATIFMPLTFIGSVYGMNFQFMPELRWKYSYPAVILLMLVLATGMIIWMKRKKWF